MNIFKRVPKTTKKGRAKEQRRAFNRAIKSKGRRYRHVIRKSRL